MNKKYILPKIHLLQSRMKYAVLQHSETPGGEEDDEFNSKKRDELEREEEEHIWETEKTNYGLW